MVAAVGRAGRRYPHGSPRAGQLKYNIPDLCQVLSSAQRGRERSALAAPLRTQPSSRRSGFDARPGYHLAARPLRAVQSRAAKVAQIAISCLAEASSRQCSPADSPFAGWPPPLGSS